MKKPVILLTGMEVPHPTFGRPMVLNMSTCFNAIENNGGLPILTSFYKEEDDIKAMVEMADGIFFTGGEDLEPALYGEEKQAYCGDTAPARDTFEMKVMQYALELDKPILCLCRGSQLLNAYLGGTLYQDIPTQAPSDIAHVNMAEVLHGSHTVNITDKDSFLYKAVGVEELTVNTTHHQGVKDVAPGLSVVATAPDGMVEATQLKSKTWVVACQWHPEIMVEEPQHKQIFTAFIEACQK